MLLCLGIFFFFFYNFVVVVIEVELSSKDQKCCGKVSE